MNFAPPDAKSQTDPAVIQRRVHELGDWFHNLNLHGVLTAPHHFLGDYPNAKWKHFAHAIPEDLGGCSVLDIGCNAGFYSLEMKRRGADRVVGIDLNPRYLAQARFAAEVNDLDIELRQMSVYDIAELGERFDLVIFMGVLCRLRHPLLALDLIHEHVSRDLLLLQSIQRGSQEPAQVEDDYPFWESRIFERSQFPRMHFIEKKYAGESENWWIPNRSCVDGMLRSAGFEILGHPETEVFICRRVDRGDQKGRGEAS